MDFFTATLKFFTVIFAIGFFIEENPYWQITYAVSSLGCAFLVYWVTK